jgi:hypothetical protein
METTTNNVQNPQESTTIKEEYQYVTKEEAKQISFRTRMEPQTFNRYRAAIEEMIGGKVGVIKTSDPKATRKNLITVGKKLGVQLSTQKTLEGLQVWVASEEEVARRKRR